ncbi:MAG: SET domain-containing protein-lysine N-methyltransferase [Proteobacteria bacterium]|nr:SET domain-containing protein-lysine N-methyltransferase [Pseudomonadota bacterium]
MYPAKVSKNSLGQCLTAADNLDPGTIVARFEGDVVEYKDVPENEICHVLLTGKDKWLICYGPARYINHSCEPNCIITDDLTVVTTCKVQDGEELTISYNTITLEEFEKDPECFFWDDRWSFKCQCGSRKCQEIINCYMIVKASNNKKV